MAVSIAVYSVVIKNETIDSLFPGGMRAYRAACPNESWCTDQRISRIGFVASEDVEGFVHFLQRAGIPCAEVAVTRQDRGLLEPRAWLETGVFEGHPIAWLAGEDPGSAFIPECDMTPSSFQLHHRAELESTYDDLGVIPRVERLRNRETGEEVFVGRPRVPSEARRRRWWWPF